MRVSSVDVVAVGRVALEGGEVGVGKVGIDGESMRVGEVEEIVRERVVVEVLVSNGSGRA